MTEPHLYYAAPPGRKDEAARWCSLHDEPEVTDLQPGSDFRHPRYRREVFLRFYEFHLACRSHPGCVYYALPWLAEKFPLDDEQKLWMTFINGNTQNIVTSWIIFKACPDFRCDTGPVLAGFFEENYAKLQFDTDRRYHKKDFLQSVACYRRLTGGQQAQYFRSLTPHEDPRENFNQVWEKVRRDFYTFGRLSAFSYTEYLRLVGVDVECPTLFLTDMDGSKSHRNGLAKVLGRDDLDWHGSTGFAGDYAPGQVEWLEREGAALLAEARARTAGVDDVDPAHVHYHTLESAFCTFKSWFRRNRRYPNVYNDMFSGRIQHANDAWGANHVSLFWNMREDCVPAHLRVERCARDPGLVPRKQNFFRETGVPIMMSRRWPAFTNSFDEEVWS